MKSRATLVYVIMLVACVGGLWGILRLGSGLRAPPDLSGAWEISPADAAAPVAADLGRTMTVDQSGRYLQVRFAGGLTADLRFDESSVDAYQTEAIRLIGPSWRMTAVRQDAGELAVRLDGPQSAEFLVRRPPDSSAPTAPPTAAAAGKHAS